MQVISNLQEALLCQVGKVPGSESFYLTGGTALAHFYLKHRRSNDLDFFTSVEEVIDPFSRRLEEALKSSGIGVERRRGLRSFVELSAARGREGTMIHLAQDAPFRFEPLKRFPEYPDLNVDTLPDIASNKLLALFGRATLRDFIDVYTLVTKGHFAAEALVEMAQKKDPGFDLYWLGVAFERVKTFGGSEPDLLLLEQSIPLERLQVFFGQWREKIVRTLSA